VVHCIKKTPASPRPVAPDKSDSSPPYHGTGAARGNSPIDVGNLTKRACGGAWPGPRRSWEWPNQAQ